MKKIILTIKLFKHYLIIFLLTCQLLSSQYKKEIDANKHPLSFNLYYERFGKYLLSKPAKV